MDTIRICRLCKAPIPMDAAATACPECGTSITANPVLDPLEPQLIAPTPAELSPFFPGLEILEVAGQGGMGTIYKARQPQLDRMVALKVLSPELGRDPAFAFRFSREAQALAKLNHTNIVSVYDFGQAGGYYYFLMEYVDGVTLRSLMDQKQVPPEEAHRIVIEVCHALQYAHDEGIVHRDIKPSNLLVDKKGRIKIADFGLASLIERDASDMRDGAPMMVVMGTPQYMAPEQIHDPHKVDGRADIYALGVVLYEMLTGHLPREPLKLPSQASAAHSHLDEIVLKSLEKRPRRRYRTASEFRSAVETATGKFHNFPGDMRQAKRRKWKWLPRFVITTGAIWLVVVTAILFKDHWGDEKTVAIPIGALEAFAAGPEGNGIGRRVITDLNLSPMQTQDLNRILKKYQQDFHNLELRHTSRETNANGHVVVTIKPFPDEMDKLLNRMWATMGPVLTSSQLAGARNSHFERFFPHSGLRPVIVEVWKDENSDDFHYIEKSPGAAPTNANPNRYRGFIRDSQKTNH